MSKILQNKNILVTRAAHQAEEFADQIEKYGGIPYVVPLLKIDCNIDRNYLKILEGIQQYEWVFFTSANGVRCFFQIWEQNFGTRNLDDKKFAVVGKKTNEILKMYGYEATFIPSVYNAETMATEFLQQYNRHHSILLVRGKQARRTLSDIFTKADIDYDSVTVYGTSMNEDSRDSLNKGLHYYHIDYITFTSPSTVEAFCSLLENSEQMKGKYIVCIGTTTAKKATEKGLENILVPEHFTIEGMITAISDHIAKKG